MTKTDKQIIREIKFTEQNDISYAELDYLRNRYMMKGKLEEEVRFPNGDIKEINWNYLIKN